jgi:hypothetical protein
VEVFGEEYSNARDGRRRMMNVRCEWNRCLSTFMVDELQPVNDASAGADGAMEGASSGGI